MGKKRDIAGRTLTALTPWHVVDKAAETFHRTHWGEDGCLQLINKSDTES